MEKFCEALKLKHLYNNLNIILKRTIIVLSFFFVSLNLFSQNYEIKIINNDISFTGKEFNEFRNKKFSDSTQVFSELQKFLQKYKKNGFIEASIDSVSFENKIVTAFFFQGKRYKISEINFSGISPQTLKSLKIKPSKYQDINFDSENITEISEKIIQFYENKGYPFVEILQENIEIKNHKVKLNLRVKKHQKILIGNIIIKGDARISQKFIQRYLDLKKDDLYSEKKIKSLDFKINQLSFLQTIKPSQLEFYKNSVDVYIYLTNKKSNNFSGIVGFIPDKENENKLKFTGDVKIQLENSLKHAEKIIFNWKKNDNSSQELNSYFQYPYIFSTPLGVEFSFNIDKIDTSFLVIENEPAINYFFQNNDKLKLFFNNKKSLVLSPQVSDTNKFSNSTLSLYGMAYETKKLNDLINPRKGYFLNLSIASGKRKFENTSELHTVLKNRLDIYLPIYKNFVFKISNENLYNFSKTKMFYNELSQIGGIKTLRGFDEKSIFASSYSIVSCELRLLFDRYSNFYIFGDIARYEQLSVDSNFSDYPFGFGIGTNISTKAGIFSINYALGKQKDNSIQFTDSKIHIAYISMF